MFDSISKAVFYKVAESETLSQLASRHGMKDSRGFARRFVAGENVDEAIEAARFIEARGMMTTLDLLGEEVGCAHQADAAADAYLNAMTKARRAGISRNFSIKLTQLGLGIDRNRCLDRTRRLVDKTRKYEGFVRIDMESSAYTKATLEIFESLWNEGYRNLGVVLQAYLYRTEADVRRMNQLGARVRLVKGAYNEPIGVAYRSKADVDAAFSKLTEILLTDGTYPAIATHDPAIIDATRRLVDERAIPRNQFEFQMLFGIRGDLQAGLTADGYLFRVYLPFGRDWFRYFMRRLGERPANLGFVLSSVFRSASR